MAKTRSSSQHLQQLIAERQRYEQWLTAVQARRTSTPPQVYTRVETEYRERIARIKEELGARAGEVRERIAGFVESLRALESEEATHRDRKTEVELRVAVGEYSAEQGGSLTAEADKELSALAGQRRSLEKDLAELREILAQTAGESRPAVATAQRPASPSAATAPAPLATAATSMSGPTGSTAAAVSGTAPKVPERAPASVAPPSQQRSSPERGASRAPTQPAAQVQSASQALAQNKTLKCAECGTFNYPTEWYCESCGAELAAV